MKPLKRIAFLVPNLKGGGLERVVINLLKGFSAQGFALDLVLAFAEGELLEEIPSGVRVIDLQTPIEIRLQSVSKIILPLIRYLRQEKPDILLSHLWYFNVVAVIARTLAFSPVTLILVEHISFKMAYGSKQKMTTIREQLLPILRRFFYPHADVIVAVSRALALDLEMDLKMKPGSIKFIYNPVIDENLIAKSKIPIEHPWFQEGEPPVILGVGRLSPEKNFPVLIRAFAQVQQVKPSRLVILGSGREEKRLKALVKDLNLEDKVAFPGFVSNPSAYMAKAAVFVLSSTREGFGNVLVEAMAVGTPVVSTDCESGPAEILDNGKYGKLVPVGNSDALAVAILKVLSAEKSLIPASWLEQFTLETATQQYSDILEINLV